MPPKGISEGKIQEVIDTVSQNTLNIIEKSLNFISISKILF